MNLQASLRAIVFVLVASSASAANRPQFLGSIGVGTGGGDLSAVTLKKGHSIRAGDGFNLSFGLLMPLIETSIGRFETQLSIGETLSSSTIPNGLARFYRTHLDWEYLFRNNQDGLRMGYGVTYQFHNRMNSEGGGVVDLSEGFEPALGWVLLVEKMLDPERLRVGRQAQNFVGLRFTKITYQNTGTRGEVDGSSICLTLTSSSETMD